MKTARERTVQHGATRSDVLGYAIEVETAWICGAITRDRVPGTMFDEALALLNKHAAKNAHADAWLYEAVKGKLLLTRGDGEALAVLRKSLISNPNFVRTLNVAFEKNQIYFRFFVVDFASDVLDRS